MMTRTKTSRGWFGSALSVIVAPLVGTACFDAPFEATCKDLCAHLESCGLLPSALGAQTSSVSAQDNCTARCQLTSEATQTEVLSCDRSEDDAGWCASSSQCAQMAQCLSRHFPEAGVLGQAGLAATTIAGKERIGTDSGCGVSECEDGSCSPPKCTESDCGPEPIHVDNPTKWCETLGLSTGRAFVRFSGTYLPGAESSCIALLSSTSSFEALDPGPVRVGLELRGAKPAAEDGATMSQPLCWVFYGPELVLKAGEQTSFTIPIASAEEIAMLADRNQLYTCEGPESCSDSIDNDGNGFIDCADPKCSCNKGMDSGAPPPMPDASVDRALP